MTTGAAIVSTWAPSMGVPGSRATSVVVSVGGVSIGPWNSVPNVGVELRELVQVASAASPAAPTSCLIVRIEVLNREPILDPGSSTEGDFHDTYTCPNPAVSSRSLVAFGGGILQILQQVEVGRGGYHNAGIGRGLGTSANVL